MFSALKIGVTGLLAAQNRLQIAANNIVNANSSGPLEEFPDPSQTIARNRAFQPQRAQNTPLAGGGVKSTAVPINPAQIPFYDPDSPDANADGLVGAPNVSLAEEFVQLILAKAAYKASATVIRTADEVADTLINETRRKA